MSFLRYIELISTVPEQEKVATETNEPKRGSKLLSILEGLLTTNKVPIVGTRSLLPIGPTKMEFDLVPDSRISPVLGVGPTGLRAGMRLQMRPEVIDKNSIVGLGLDNQQLSSGAEVELTPRKK